MLTPTAAEGDLNKLGKRGIIFVSSLVLISFLPLALQAFMEFSPSPENHPVITQCISFFQTSSSFFSIFILVLAFCISKRGINKPELILCIVYGFLGLTMLADFLISFKIPQFISTCRLTIEYTTPVLIANHLGIFGAKSGRRAKAVVILLPLISITVIVLSIVKPLNYRALELSFIPIQNPYDMFPLVLLLTSAFWVYPRLARNYASYTLQAYWAATIPAICGVILTLFTPQAHQDIAIFFNLLYIFISRSIILGGLLADTFRRENAYTSLENQLFSKEGRVKKYKMAYREKEQTISEMKIDFAEKAFYHKAYSRVFDNVQTLALILSPNGKVVSANSYGETLLSLPADLDKEAIDINDIIPASLSLDACLTLLKKEPKATRQLEFQNIENNTQFKLTATLCASYEDDNPDEISSISITAPDTRQQQQLKDENLRLQWQMSITPSPIIEFTEDGSITYINEEAKMESPSNHPTVWQHPLLRNIKTYLSDLKAGKKNKLERKILCGKRYFNQTLTYNKLFNRFILYSLDITESGKKLADSEKVVNYAAWLQQQFCIHFTQPYELLNIMLKQSIEWLDMGEAVICTKNDDHLTRIAVFPEAGAKVGQKDPHSDMLMQMLSNLPTGPFEMPTAENDTNYPCMGYHLNVNERSWGVLYYTGGSQTVERSLRQNILGNLGTWLTMVISQTSTTDIATRHYYLSPSPMFTCTHDGQLTRANTAFEKLFDVHESSIPDVSLTQFFAKSETKKVLDIFSIPPGNWMIESTIQLNTAESSNTSFRILCTADPLTELLFCLIIPNASGNVSNASVHEGMSRIGREISTPLSCVVGMTELLEGSGLNIRQKNFVEQIRQSADMLIGLTDTINDYSLLRSGGLELNIIQFDLQNLLEQIFSAFENEAASKGVSMFLHYNAHTPRCFWGDRERIGSILRNLIGNAVRFTEIGYVSAVIHDTNAGDSSAHVVQITVEDSGAGISKEDQKDLFSENANSHQHQHYSMGLGLATARELAGMMNGDITVESTPGHGSTFTLKMQIQPAPLLRENQTTICELNIRRAMLIMGNPLVMQIISDTLDNATLECDTYTESATALTAIDQAIEDGNPYRLIVVDEEIRHPDLRTFAKKVKEQRGHEDLVLLRCSLDGYRSHADRTDDLFNETIHSPITPIRILKVLSRIFAPDTADRPRHALIPESTVNLKRTIDILIADNDLLNRDIMSGLMEKTAAVIDISSEGARAVELACRHHYDIIFMATNLPGMDGLEATRAIRKVEAGKRHTPIIAILNANDPKLKKQTRLAGMDTYLTKPMRRRNLNRILHEFIIEAAIIDPAPMTSLTETVDLYPLEINKAAKEMGVKKNLYVRIIRMFTDSLGEHMNLISEAYENRNAANLSLSSRKLGRSAANLHLYEFKNTCLKLEELSDSGEWENLRNQIEVLQQHTKQLQGFTENLPS